MTWQASLSLPHRGLAEAPPSLDPCSVFRRRACASRPSTESSTKGLPRIPFRMNLSTFERVMPSVSRTKQLKFPLAGVKNYLAKN